MSVTVATLITRAKQRSDMENRDNVSDSEWIMYVNAGYKKLYDLLVAKFEDYFTVSTTFTIAAGATSSTLPASFYKLRGVDRAMDGTAAPEYYAILPFNFEKRNSRGFLSRYYSIQPDIRYRIMSNTLMFSPEDQAPGSYRIWYTPVATDLTLTTNTVDGVNGFEEFIEFDAAIQAIIKEESDASALMAERMKVEQRIIEMAANRDIGEVEAVGDVSGFGSGYYDGFLPR